MLDRWQHTGPDSPTPPPVISPKPMTMRKSFTVEPAQTSPTTSSYSVPLKRDGTGTAPVLRSKSSMPTLPTMRTGYSVSAASTVTDPNFQAWLGSSKTVVTYVQFNKTGDASPPASQSASLEVDELGLRVRTRTTSGGLVQERGQAGMPADAAGKPLSHVRSFW